MQLVQKKDIKSMINSREAKIAVIGLGYVGLPTAALFASLGFKVKGVDINPKIIKAINSGDLQTTERGLRELVLKINTNGCFVATTDCNQALIDSNVIIVCVQTPVDDRGVANLSFLSRACDAISAKLRPNTLVIIQSTVPPKTLATTVIPILEKGSHLKCGEGFWFAYCPERMAPGNGLNDLSTTARLIGAFNSESADVCTTLFGAITNGKLLITDMGSAEVSKLAENTFRFVNIAFANELAILCKKIGVDVKEVIRLANTHPRVNIHQPGCGAGGPCLTKDSHILLNSVSGSKVNVSVISAAFKVNNNMPIYMADLAINGLKKVGKKVAGSKIAVLGTAYKADVDDSRNSPTAGIIKRLCKKRANVVVYDPVCSEHFGQSKAATLVEALEHTDCVIIAVDHKVFYDINLTEVKSLMNSTPIIVDSKRIISPSYATELGFLYITSSYANNEKTGLEAMKKYGEECL